MSAETRNADALRIGEWRLDPLRNELARGGKTLRLEPKAIEVLVYLARRAGQVVGRDELLAAVWPGVIVGDDALTQAVIKLRKALEDDVRSPAYIETIAKRGYRLVAPVGAVSSPPTAQAPSRVPRGRTRVLLAIAAAIALGVLGLQFWSGSPEPEGRETALPIIAVLPFANLSGDAQREYFSDGVTEDIIHGLGRFSAVRVIAKNSVDIFKGRPASTSDVRRELGARYIVKGSVREAEGTVRVTVELSDSARGMLLWSDRYEGADQDIFRIQDRIVQSVVAKLAVKLTNLEAQRASTKPVESLETYELVLRARALLAKGERAANREARALLSRARELSPGYADIYVALATAEHQRVIHGWIEHVDAGLQRAEAFAQRALSMKDVRADARAHALLGTIYTLRGDFDRALTEVERAIELNPSDTEALLQRGSVLLFRGRIDEAITAYETASRYDPHMLPGSAGGVSNAYYAAGRYAEALATADRFLQRHPDVAYLHVARTAALAQLGRLDEARKSAAAVRTLDPLFRVENWATRFLNPEHTARFQEGLRKAGL